MGNKVVSILHTIAAVDVPRIANKEIKTIKLCKTFLTQTQSKAYTWLLEYTCPQAANHSLFFESETVLKFSNLEACVLLSRITDSQMCRWLKNQLTLFVACSTDYHPFHFSLCFMTFYLRYFCMYEINNHNITILFLFSEQRKTKLCQNLRHWQLMLPSKVQRSLRISAV